MSYDLYFRSRRSENNPTWEDMHSYFDHRTYYSVSETQAFYENEATGIYFSFEEHDVEKTSNGHVDIRGDKPYLELLPVTFNLNYLRPHIFGLEAEREVTAFVSAFDLLVYDPQIDGMGDGIYTPGGFLKGWNSGNDFAHSALFSVGLSSEIFTLPTEKLDRCWRWDVAHEELVERYDDRGIFIPKIWFVVHRGKVCTAVTWAEGIEIALPAVDLILTHRSSTALSNPPGGTDEQIVVRMASLLPQLERFERCSDPCDHFFVEFDHDPDRTQSELAKLFSGKHGDWSELRRVSTDRVLNAEIVDKYLGR